MYERWFYERVYFPTHESKQKEEKLMRREREKGERENMNVLVCDWRAWTLPCAVYCLCPCSRVESTPVNIETTSLK